MAMNLEDGSAVLRQALDGLDSQRLRGMRRGI
jgi:hypothetical protein